MSSPIISNHSNEFLKVPVIVPAAGVGRRMGAECPKQYLPLMGKTILEITVDVLMSHPNVGTIFVVVNPSDQHYKTLSLFSHPNIVWVDGGEERVDSVYAGLKAARSDNQWAMVHDAARPCVSHKDISSLLTLVDSLNNPLAGGILAMPVVDTMKQQREATTQVDCTLNRELMWHALTPQLFQIDSLIAAIEFARAKNVSITDEASAMEAYGGQVTLVNSARQNIKVTQPDDLALAEFYLSKKVIE